MNWVKLRNFFKAKIGSKNADIFARPEAHGGL